MEWSGKTLVNLVLVLVLDIYPDFLKHDCIHDVEDFVRKHRNLVVFFKFLVFLLAELHCFLDGGDDWVLHNFLSLFYDSFVVGSKGIT